MTMASQFGAINEATSAQVALGTYGRVPEWTKADRLRKSREAAGMERPYLAQLTGLSLTTISNYENGHGNPRASNMRMWAVATGVPFEWLDTGTVPAEATDEPKQPPRD